MRAASGSKLYSVEMLGLATRLASYPFTGTMPLHHKARSRTCGSSVEIELAQDDAGLISDIGMRVSACAIGQASAAIMAAQLAGHSREEVAAIHDAIRQWLDGKGPMPDWPQFSMLEPVIEHEGRHGALILPWEAATAALSNRNAGR